MEAAVTAAKDGLEGLAWNVVGHTYTPKLHSENAMIWHAIIPDGTFVPPHVHPKQDEWIVMLSGNLEVEFGADVKKAGPGDTVCMPMGKPHGIFNRSGAERQTVRPVQGASQCHGSGRTGAPVGPARRRFPAAAGGVSAEGAAPAGPFRQRTLATNRRRNIRRRIAS